MGTLDEAIREHLELKRQHGAAEDELREIEAEAFGPGEGGEDQEGNPAAIEAPTEIVSEAVSSEAEVAPDAVEADEAEAEAAVEVAVEATPEVAAEVAPEAPAAEESLESPEEELDAGDALESERAQLSGHPTEHYDVDAAIAEEEELDLLSEGRLSEELDRALGAPSEDFGGLGDSFEDTGPSTGESDLPPEPEAVVEEPEVIEEVVEDHSAEVEIIEEPAPSPETGPESDRTESPGNPLEGTPDFLEDSPESEDLWFEQKEPKDFDFGD